MSVATEFAPIVYIPSGARQSEYHGATVVSLLAPSERSIAAPLRLTRRGVAAIAVLVVVLSVAVVGLAWLSAPAATAAGHVPASVAVHQGDTLWSIASRVAPNRDPRAEIADLQRVNHLSGVDLVAGEVLRTS
jgi:hypothetical protein